ncbi:MAG: metallophosphoesterase, partial [Antricoccus sp.]
MQSPSSEQPDLVPDVDHTAADDSLVIESATESADGAELHIVEREPWFRHLSARIAIRVAIALLGVVIGVLIGGHTTANVGPMQVRADLSFGAGGATINIPPIGALSVDAYKGPLNLNMTVLQVDEAKATQFIQSGADINALTAQVTSDVRSAMIWLLVKSILWAIVSAAVLSLLVFRRYRAIFLAGGLSVVMIAATIVVGYATFSSSKLQEPRYSGILAQAPALVGNVENLAAKFGDYRKSLLKMVQNVSNLYTAVSTLPGDPGVTDAIRVLHVSDIHLNPAGYDLTASLAKQYNVNLIIDTGDIVDWGSQGEAPQLNQIATYGVPYVYVRGNHDSMAIQAKVASEKNAVVLDDTSTTIDGLTIAGTGDPRFSPDRETLNGEPLDKAVPAQAK